LILSEFCEQGSQPVKRIRRRAKSKVGGSECGPFTAGSIIRAMRRTMLAGLDARSFLSRHWQRRPLLARRALPHYENLVTREALFGRMPSGFALSFK
jgi:hypothetical protein